jgi:hypothetical protein
MFRLRLHPTSSGFLLGLATIAFWALLWISIVAQLQGAFGPTYEVQPLASAAAADPVLAIAFDFDQAPPARGR